MWRASAATQGLLLKSVASACKPKSTTPPAQPRRPPSRGTTIKTGEGSKQTHIKDKDNDDKDRYKYKGKDNEHHIHNPGAHGTTIETGKGKKTHINSIMLAWDRSKHPLHYKH